jgi:hypothetical protein
VQVPRSHSRARSGHCCACTSVQPNAGQARTGSLALSRKNPLALPMRQNCCWPQAAWHFIVPKARSHVGHGVNPKSSWLPVTRSWTRSYPNTSWQDNLDSTAWRQQGGAQGGAACAHNGWPLPHSPGRRPGSAWAPRAGKAGAHLFCGSSACAACRWQVHRSRGSRSAPPPPACRSLLPTASPAATIQPESGAAQRSPCGVAAPSSATDTQ